MPSERARRRVLLAVAVAGTSAACVHAEGHRICRPVSSWAAPSFHCAPIEPDPVAAAPLEPVTEPPPPPEPEPEPEPAPAVVVTAETIELSETVQFESNSAVLLEVSGPLLDAVATTLIDHPELRLVQIEGHTDSQAGRTFNQKLSERRAAAVGDHLVRRGVDPDRLVIAGFGEDQPVSDNDTAEGRFRNRRVDLRILERQ